MIRMAGTSKLQSNAVIMKSGGGLGSPGRHSPFASASGGGGGGDPTLTLDLDFLQNAGSNMASVTTTGPTFTFTRASDARSFNESGVIVTASTDAPRFNHDPANSNAALGMLVEEARTNRCLQSEVFKTTWIPISSPNITDNSTVAPDGTTTADTIEDPSSNGSSLEQIFASVSDDTEIYTASVYILKDNDETRFPEMRHRLIGGTAQQVEVGLNTKTGATSGTVTGTGTFGAIDSGSWWRLWATIINNNTGNTGHRVNLWPAYGSTINVASNAATGSIICWGFQAEIGPFPSSYIPTTTVAVTRALDAPPLTTDVDGIDASNLSVFVQASIPTVSALNRALVTIDDGSAGDRARLYLDAAENVNFETVRSSDTSGASDGAAVIAINTTFKAMGTYEDDSVIGYVNGTASTTDTTAAIPLANAATTIRIGGDSDGTQINGSIQKVKIWNGTQSSTFGESETT